ncbi:hypothetical protein AKG11_03755 [Shinella sp. SUS2]|uniref:hypothetical protein n=1 Tax=unclassified Shinella TaxID=2643062 RepID=UPI000680414E|nr:MULTISPECIES: hypothetical protein [unclassified Shinella]KNY18256.1 hypothetical protein AKG11_03755 [Shinella sp. SUS2]KOC77451.1 hypothetical protein AKG10_01225 [Shinella sp. GWS1]
MVENADAELIDSLARFLDQHTNLPEEACRTLIRNAAAGQPISLPDAYDFAGEVLRAKLDVLLTALAPKAAKPHPVVVQSAPALATPPAQATPPDNALPDLTGEARAAAIRAMAGSDLSAMAEVLIAGSASVSDAHAAFKIARSQQLRPSHIPSIAERAASQIEMGPADFTGFTSAADRKEAGWKKAFAKAETSPSAPNIV